MNYLSKLGRGLRPLRYVLVGMFVVFAATHVVRTAAVAAFAETDPDLARLFWSDHPEVIRSVAMAEVGTAAARGREPSPGTLSSLRALMNAEPLAVEALLVQAAIAQRRGDVASAEELLIAARRRDPRSAAARFLLADLYVRTGRIAAGLSEMVVLGRLVPGAQQQVVPALAAYATSPGAASQLRQILRTYPELKPALLGRLAADPANADLMLAIAAPSGSSEQVPSWQEELLRGMVGEGDYARAHQIWARLAGLGRPARDRLFDPEFAGKKAPPPFNWTFASDAKGVAEPAPGGLRINYYGRDPAVLASQLTRLTPGRYRLSMSVSGSGVEEGVAWRLVCLPDKAMLLELPLSGSDAPTREFIVPADCAAQSLELIGKPREFPQTVDLLISDLKLERLDG